MVRSHNMRSPTIILFVSSLLAAPVVLAANSMLRDLERPCIDNAGMAGGSTVPCNIPNSRTITTTPRPYDSYIRPDNSDLRRSPATTLDVTPSSASDRGMPQMPATPQTAPYGTLPPPGTNGR
jgi:hypothetical protein